MSILFWLSVMRVASLGLLIGSSWQGHSLGTDLQIGLMGLGLRSLPLSILACVLLQMDLGFFVVVLGFLGLCICGF